MATHSSTLAWRIPWIKEPGGLQFIGLQRDRLKQLSTQHTEHNIGIIHKFTKSINIYIKLLRKIYQYVAENNKIL